MRQLLTEIDDPTFAFCENRHASGRPTWHIRRIGDKGVCLGGGADTDALCGREVDWDCNVAVIAEIANSGEVCADCAGKWRESAND